MRSLAFLVAALVCACTSAPPERSERERLMMAALESCKRQYPAVRDVDIDETGRIWARARWESPEWDGFRRCAAEALQRAAEQRPFGAGRLAAGAASSIIAFRPAGALMVVPVAVNGAAATFLLDTGSSVTAMSTVLAQRAGVQMPARAPVMSVGVGGGQRLVVPYTSVKSVRVGAAEVEGMEVAVFDGLVPALRGVDGVLGVNFLNHFRVTIDRQARLVTLERH